MVRPAKRTGKVCLLTLTATLMIAVGCQASRQQASSAVRAGQPRLGLPAPIDQPPGFNEAADLDSSADVASIRLVAVDDDADRGDAEPAVNEALSDAVEIPAPAETLDALEALAVESNPTLRRMQHEAAAAWDKTRYIDKLPDPSLGSTFFAPPMNFEPDRQVADVQLMQMIPWLSRLKAEAQRACMEALVAENLYQAERLRVIGDVRVTWFKLYVLAKQIETTVADQAQLESLIRTANARVATGNAQPGDVLMATLELSSLQEQLISYRQQVVAATAELNRLVGRDAATPIRPQSVLVPESPDWDHALLRQVALESQPELNAARLRTAATRWGVEVARLKRRPDLTFGVGWVIMDAPGSTMPGAGADSVMLEVATTLPVSRGKYEAMISEASREHFAAHASEDEVIARLDAVLRELLEQARASQQTVELYEKSILPQARQTFEADQKSLVNNSVTFDRVIRDYRTLLNLELGYHRALGQHASTLARIRQTVGVDLVAARETPSPPSAP